MAQRGGLSRAAILLWGMVGHGCPHYSGYVALRIGHLLAVTVGVLDIGLQLLFLHIVFFFLHWF